MARARGKYYFGARGSWNPVSDNPLAVPSSRRLVHNSKTIADDELMDEREKKNCMRKLYYVFSYTVVFEKTAQS